jgi:hypothetical protein
MERFSSLKRSILSRPILLHAGHISVGRYRVSKRPFTRGIVRRLFDRVFVRLWIRLLIRFGWLRRGWCDFPLKVNAASRPGFLSFRANFSPSCGPPVARPPNISDREMVANDFSKVPGLS